MQWCLCELISSRRKCIESTEIIVSIRLVYSKDRLMCGFVFHGLHIRLYCSTYYVCIHFELFIIAHRWPHFISSLSLFFSSSTAAENGLNTKRKCRRRGRATQTYIIYSSVHRFHSSPPVTSLRCADVSIACRRRRRWLDGCHLMRAHRLVLDLSSPVLVLYVKSVCCYWAAAAAVSGAPSDHTQFLYTKASLLFSSVLGEARGYRTSYRIQCTQKHTQKVSHKQPEHTTVWTGMRWATRRCEQREDKISAWELTLRMHRKKPPNLGAFVREVTREDYSIVGVRREKKAQPSLQSDKPSGTASQNGY